jgi:hypothetical protein
MRPSSSSHLSTEKSREYSKEQVSFISFANYMGLSLFELIRNAIMNSKRIRLKLGRPPL